MTEFHSSYNLVTLSVRGILILPFVLKPGQEFTQGKNYFIVQAIYGYQIK